MGETANWEFAAVVAAVTMGLGGLLLFTLIGTLGSWRVFRLAAAAANEAAKASLATQELARQLAMQERLATAAPSIDLRETAGALGDLRRQADALIAQQARLQDAVRNLIEAGVLNGGDSRQHLGELENAIKRLENNLGQVAAAVANLSQKIS